MTKKNTKNAKNTTFTAGDDLTKLVGTSKEGDFVHAGQEMGGKEGFKNVSKKWMEKTITFEDGLRLLEEGRAKTNDIMATVREMVPGVNIKGQCVLTHTSGLEFRPTPLAVGHLGDKAGCGKWYASRMMGVSINGEALSFAPDREDAQTLAQVLANGFRRLDPDRQYLWRTRDDGTLRALLTDRYSIVDNRWLLETLRELVPGGRLSHWRGDSDTIYGNILIPDTIREEKDSDYGGMLSVGNSEIGERRISSLPSVFRAICQNGCIWGQEKGRGIKQYHRGNIDLDSLYEAIKANLEVQIPLLPRGIDQLLATRSMAWKDGSIHPLLAQVAIDASLTRKEAVAMLAGYHDERNATGEMAKSLFGVIAAVTRAGQKMPPSRWVQLDELGGQLTIYSEADWLRLVMRAKSLKSREVEEVFHAQAG